MVFRSVVTMYAVQMLFNGSVQAGDLTSTIWKTGCQSSSTQDHSNLTAAFAEKEFSFTTNNFDKADCAGGSLAELKLTGAFIAADQKIDFTYSTAMFTPLDSRVVFYLNLKRSFGYVDWKLNVAKNVAGRSVDAQTPPVPSAGARAYDIYKVDQTKLFFGKRDQGHDASSVEKRPVAYDVTKPFQTLDAQSD